MRLVLLLGALVASAAPLRAACLDECVAEFGGSGTDYADCVEECGTCGDGEVDGDEECDDGNTVAGDCCDAGCRAEPEGSPCAEEDDDELCTSAICDGDGECDHEEVPATTCRWPIRAGAGTLVIRDGDKDARDQILWHWRRGEATKDDFGDPLAETSYALCVYDASGLVSSVSVPAGERCGDRPCWDGNPSGFRYRNPARTPEGAGLVLLRRARRGGSARITFKAAGEDLDVPDPGALESPLTVQLRRSGSATCWSAQFGFPPARRNGETTFKDRADAAPEPSTTTTTTSTTPPPTVATTTTSTLAGATVDVTVRDAAGLAVEDALVTIRSAGAEVSDATDEAGRVVFTGQPAGVAAVVAAEDDDDRTGEVAIAGFQIGLNQVTVTVR